MLNILDRLDIFKHRLTGHFKTEIRENDANFLYCKSGNAAL